MRLVAATYADWTFRAIGPLAGAVVVWFARKVGRNVDEMNTNIRAVPGIRSDLKVLQNDVRELTHGMEQGRQVLNTRLDLVEERLDDRALMSQHVGTIARLMEQRISQGPPRRADDPPHDNHIPERAP